MTAQATPRHRVTSGTAQMRAIATDLADASVWSMDATETTKTLVQLSKLAAQVAELEARVAAHADDLNLGEENGATSTATWLAVQTRTTRPAVRRVVGLGHDLDRHRTTRRALAAGDLVAEQARVIIEWVDKLPDDLGPDIPERAEAHLVAQAAHHGAKTLGVLGRRILDVVAPEVADAQEAKALEREERAAMAAARISMGDDGHGQCHGRFTIPTYHGAALRKMLLALSAPKHLTATEGASVAHRPGPEKLGRAFCELIERIPAKKLPQAGGLDATVVVFIDQDALFRRLEKAGVLDTGERISPGMVRRIACRAGILPVVLGGKSEVLDLGRKRRLFSKAQRVALAIRDGGCTTEGCDWPPGLCHSHHDWQWAHDGPTDLAYARLLCPRHHTYAHDPAYETTKHPSGKVSFHRRT